MQLFFKAKLKESPHCVVVMASSLQICIERRRLILIKIVYPNEKKISNTFFTYFATSNLNMETFATTQHKVLTHLTVIHSLKAVLFQMKFINSLRRTISVK